ncbi:DUF6817 domain-containing protein [Aurantivibrio plasticivorans]
MIEHAKTTDPFEQLADLDAGDFAHINGNLLEHLSGTRALLAEWEAPSYLQDAGLYHAAYGTAEFEAALVNRTQRDKIADVIGAQAESVVYCYCACDRKHFFSQVGISTPPVYRDRFTGQTRYLSAQELRDFCELTAANESELGLEGSDFLDQHGEALGRLFLRMTPYLSQGARLATRQIFTVR